MTGGIELTIVVEGETEEQFVRKVLAPVLGERGVFAIVQRVETSRRKIRPDQVSHKDYIKVYRGGLTDYEQAKRDIGRWLNRRDNLYVSSMFDYYALPDNFPGVKQISPSEKPHENVKILEEAFTGDINNNRFIPYIQLHEFEALLFSDVNEIDAVLSVFHKSQLKDLNRINEKYNNPEEIDDGKESAPSKRLDALYPGYRNEKITNGITIAQRIGVEKLRKACPHFNEWVTRLESLATEQN